MDQEDQLEQVELDLSEAAAGESPAEVPQAVPEQTYDSLFPALPMGATKPARSAVPNNATPMVKVTSSRITQVRIRVQRPLSGFVWCQRAYLVSRQFDGIVVLVPGHLITSSRSIGCDYIKRHAFNKTMKW